MMWSYTPILVEHSLRGGGFGASLPVQHPALPHRARDAKPFGSDTGGIVRRVPP